MGTLSGVYPYYYLAGFRLNSLIWLNESELMNLGDFLIQSFISRFESIHQGLLFSQNELSGDKRRAACIHDKSTIVARMSMEENHIWQMTQREEQAFQKWRGNWHVVMQNLETTL